MKIQAKIFILKLCILQGFLQLHSRQNQMPKSLKTEMMTFINSDMPTFYDRIAKVQLGQMPDFYSSQAPSRKLFVNDSSNKKISSDKIYLKKLKAKRILNQQRILQNYAKKKNNDKLGLSKNRKVFRKLTRRLSGVKSKKIRKSTKLKVSRTNHKINLNKTKDFESSKNKTSKVKQSKKLKKAIQQIVLGNSFKKNQNRSLNESFSKPKQLQFLPKRNQPRKMGDSFGGIMDILSGGLNFAKENLLPIGIGMAAGGTLGRHFIEKNHQLHKAYLNSFRKRLIMNNEMIDDMQDTVDKINSQINQQSSKMLITNDLFEREFDRKAEEIRNIHI